MMLYLFVFVTLCIVTAMHIRIRDLGSKNFWEVIDENQEDVS